MSCEKNGWHYYFATSHHSVLELILPYFTHFRLIQYTKNMTFVGVMYRSLFFSEDKSVKLGVYFEGNACNIDYSGKAILGNL